METKEIKSTAWEGFCRKIQDIRPRLTIDRVDRDGKRSNVVDELELREARFDGNEACNDMINLTLAENNGEIVEYVITEPIHIKLRRQNSDRYDCIEITAKNGTHVLSARPGFRQDLLADLV